MAIAFLGFISLGMRSPNKYLSPNKKSYSHIFGSSFYFVVAQPLFSLLLGENNEGWPLPEIKYEPIIWLINNYRAVLCFFEPNNYLFNGGPVINLGRK